MNKKPPLHYVKGNIDAHVVDLGEVVAKADFDLLHKQKMILVAMLLKTPLTKKRKEALDGIVNFLDSVLDTAETADVWEHPDGRTM